MKSLGDFDASAVIYGKFTTYQPSTGAAFTLGGTPALSVYKDNSTTQSTSGVTLTAGFDSVTGLNHFAIDTSSDGTFYSAGSFFDIVITTGTVDGVSVVGSVVASFTIRKNSALKPATAGRTIVVDTNGVADARLADAVAHGGTLGSSTATLALSRLTVASQTSNTNAITATGNGTGHGAALTSGSGATGNGLTLLAASTNGHGLKSTGTGTGDGAELTAGASGADLDADIAGTITTATNVTTVSTGAISEASYATTAGSVHPLGIIDQGTAQAATGTTLRLRSAAAFADDELIGSTILVTGGSAGVGQSRVITDYASATDTATVDAWTTTPTGTITYKVFATAPGNAPTAAQIADQVWDELLSGHAVSGSAGEALSAAGTAGDPWTTALPGAYGAGTAGKIIGDNINATISSRATQTSVDTIDDFVDTEVAAIFSRIGAPVGASISADIAAVKAETATILADTNEVQISLAAGGLIESMVDDLQTEVDGIQADTEDIQTRLPAALVSGRIDASVGAMAANVMTAAAAAADLTTELQNGLATAAALATVDTVVDAIQAKTDSLTFTVAGQVDANIQYVNDVAVTGDGQSGTEWGPA